MKKRAAFVIYRNWAFNITKKILALQKLKDYFESAMLITTPEHEFSIAEAEKFSKVYVVDGKDNERIYQLLKKAKIDAAFFYGWSWMVNKEIISNFLCLALHPSPLPKYRGGSPIQNQILKGEKQSAITVFKISEGIDNGDIYMQLPMSLEGDINDIFKRMVDAGIRITKQFLLDLKNQVIKFYPQKNLHAYPPFKRRRPEESEINLEHLDQMNYKDVYNLVRGLTGPYPNAFVLFLPNRILIQKIEKAQNPDQNVLVLNSQALSKYNISDLTSKEMFLKLKDGYARLLKFKVEKI